jgi:enterochelin esterase-like enzyme
MNIRFALAWLVLGAAAFARAAPPTGFDVEKPGVPHGRIESITYASKTLGFERPATIYFPPGYSNEKRYPTLYLLHGAGDDEKGWQTRGAAAAILDNLYADEKTKMTPMLVVMPLGFAKKPGDPMPTDGKERGRISRAFDEDFLKDLVPFIDAAYPTIADAKGRAIAGLSMGGSQALRIGPANPDMFAYVGVFSSLLRDPFPEAFTKAIEDPAALNAKLKLLYYATGDKDRNADAIKAFHEQLDAKKLKHRWEIKSGGHEWKVWRECLAEFAPLLFKD